MDNNENLSLWLSGLPYDDLKAIHSAVFDNSFLFPDDPKRQTVFSSFVKIIQSVVNSAYVCALYEKGGKRND